MIRTWARFSAMIGQKIFSLDSTLYVKYLRHKGVLIGENTTFYGNVRVDISRPYLIEIGKNCVLTNGVQIVSHGYDLSVLRGKFGEFLSSSGKIVIGDNVFIGFNSIILKGVRIGQNVIIGAGSIVTHDIASDTVAAGNPCKVIMTIEEYYQKRKVQYIEEAKAYALEIYKKTKNVPKSDFFWNEFPLFLKRDGPWGKLPVRSELGSAINSFLTSEPIYNSFEDFLIDAGIPAEKIKKVKVP